MHSIFFALQNRLILEAAEEASTSATVQRTEKLGFLRKTLRQLSNGMSSSRDVVVDSTTPPYEDRVGEKASSKEQG